jgi:hypothetical protein
VIGRVFGRLTVHSLHGSKRAPCGRMYRMWRCACECAGAKYRGCTGLAYVTTENLRSGNTKSCGCLRYDAIMSARPWDHVKNPGRKRAS